MRDAVTSLIKNYDLAGRYFDRNAIDSLKSYFDSGTVRVQAAAAINSNAAALVKQAGLKLYEELPELIRPGGNAYRLVVMRLFCAIWITTCATLPMRWLLATRMYWMNECCKGCGKLTIL